MDDRLADALDRYSPAVDPPVDWDDVRSRAGARRARRTRRRAVVAALALAAAFAVAATPVVPAIARTLDGFSSWLSGTPGTKATPEEQQAFERANARSWAAFPGGTELRRLVRARAAGSTFTLYGFRSGGSLCLRLVAKGPAAGTTTSCAPVTALERAKEPALVVTTDSPFGEQRVPRDPNGYVPPLASATFGVVSDGVRGVVLTGDDGRHRSLVAGNAFLYVADHPKLGARIRKAEAVARDGSRVTLPFSWAPFGFLGLQPEPTARPRGPHGVERNLTGGTVGWLERRELRGRPLPPTLYERLAPFHFRGRAFAREIRPDPGDTARVAFLVGRPNPRTTLHDLGKTWFCRYLVTDRMIGGGCSPLDEFFDREPVSNGTSIALGGDQYAYFSGVVSDDVASLRLFLANGTTDDVPIADNAYVVPVDRSLFPARLVAYDAAGRIVGNEVFADDGTRTKAPRAARTSMRVRLRVTGAHGTTGALSVGDLAGGYRCREFQLAGGSGAGGCSKWPYTGPALLTIARMSAGRDVFLEGVVPSRVAVVEVRYAGGETARIRPIAGAVAYAVPAGHPRPGGEVVVLSALDARGNVIARRGMRLHH